MHDMRVLKLLFHFWNDPEYTIQGFQNEKEKNFYKFLQEIKIFVLEPIHMMAENILIKKQVRHGG